MFLGMHGYNSEITITYIKLSVQGLTYTKYWYIVAYSIIIYIKFITSQQFYPEGKWFMKKIIYRVQLNGLLCF